MWIKDENKVQRSIWQTAQRQETGMLWINQVVQNRTEQKVMKYNT